MSPNFETNSEITGYLVKLLGDYFNSSPTITINDLLKVLVSFNVSMAATIVGARCPLTATEDIMNTEEYKNLLTYIAAAVLDKIDKVPDSTETIKATHARTQ